MVDMPNPRTESGWERIVLGTVSLGLPYGRRHGEAALGRQEVEAILGAAWSAGIRAFDTAETYGSAAGHLAEWLHDRGRLREVTVVTKISPEASADTDQAEAACRRFCGAASLVLLSHGALDAPEFVRFTSLAQSYGAEAGQSVYTVLEVQQAAEAGTTRVQAPVNVLDTGQLDAAHHAGISLDARSVYLQGVLLDPPEVAERRVVGAGMVAQAIQTAARLVGLPVATALLAGVLAQLAQRDRLVIGIDEPSQLEDVAASFEVPLETVHRFYEAIAGARHSAQHNAHLLDPRTWGVAA